MLIALISARRRGFRAARGWRPRARWIAATSVAAVALAAGAALAAEHFEHYAARGRDSDRSVLNEILAQPLCGGQAGSGAERDVAAR
ncbi:MAG: hypothetical protein ACRCVA_21030 [Phreatobacter sp.]